MFISYFNLLVAIAGICCGMVVVPIVSIISAAVFFTLDRMEAVSEAKFEAVMRKIEEM